MPSKRGLFMPASTEAPRDADQPELVGVYEALGCTVVDLGSVGNGITDLLIGCAGITDLAEVKIPGEELWSLSRLRARVPASADEARRGCVSEQRLLLIHCCSNDGIEITLESWPGRNQIAEEHHYAC
jgi:hypothetical protein